MMVDTELTLTGGKCSTCNDPRHGVQQQPRQMVLCLLVAALRISEKGICAGSLARRRSGHLQSTQRAEALPAKRFLNRLAQGAGNAAGAVTCKAHSFAQELCS